MSDIKILYFDSIGLDQSLIESKLINLKIKYCVIKEGLLLVKYSDCSKQLFNQLLESDNRYYVFIADLDMSNDSYWGFLNKAFWEWLNENKSTESENADLIKS